MSKNNKQIMTQIRNGLIVSCQALPEEPLYRPEGGIMKLMALAAVEAGAVGIRTSGVQDIKQIKETVDVPVIGIIKRIYPGSDLHITVTMDEIDALASCGVDIIAFDGTNRKRPDGTMPTAFVRRIRENYGDILLMADISTFEEGMAMAAAGVDFVGTTMSGYTPYTEGKHTGFDRELVRRLAMECPVPVIAEGRVSTPEDAAECLSLGAHAVVVGGAITRPLQITEKFVKAMRQ